MANDDPITLDQLAREFPEALRAAIAEMTTCNEARPETKSPRALGPGRRSVMADGLENLRRSV